MGARARSGALDVAAVSARQALLRLVRERSTTSAVVQNFIVRIALIGLTFGTGIIVARTLAPLGRGEQAALALWPILLSGLATFGLPMAVGYLSRREPADAGRLYFAALAVAVVAGALVTVAGIAAMPLFLRDYPASFVGAARGMMFFAPQILVLYVIRAHLEAHGEYTRSIVGQLVSTGGTLIALIVLRLAGMLTPASAALSYYVPSALLTMWLLVQLWPRVAADVHSLLTDVQRLFSYGLRSYGTDLINTLSAQLDLAVIVAFLNPLQLGLYSVALTLARLLNIVQQSLVTVLFPHASGLDSESAIALVGRGARLSTIVSVALGVALLVVVPFALPLVYGASFSAAIPVMPYLTAEAILAGLSNVLIQAFLTTGRPAVVTLIQGGWLVCAMLLLLALVPRLALSGAAVALLAASIARIGFIAIAYRVVLQRNVPRLLPDRSDWHYLFTRFTRGHRAEATAS